jgi:ABC-2 type transport system ATP-binding protein
MLASIRALAAGGTTLMLSSHQMFAIENACSAFCIIGAGEVRASGTLAQLRENFPTRTIVVDPDLPELRTLFARMGATQSSALASLGTLAYDVPAATDFAALLRSAAEIAPVQSFERREPSLGDIYVLAQNGSLV